MSDILSRIADYKRFDVQVQVITLALNALLAPILIAGWLTGKPFGVAGAGCFDRGV